MGFLSPWFLGGLAALGLPVYLHLLRQHRSQPLPFSSTMFLEQRTQSSIMHRRLKYLALMAMRLALLLLLALAFANPFVNRKVPPAGAGKKLYVFAIDNSFSMRSSGHLDEAKRQAASEVSSVNPGDQAQVIAFASHANVLAQNTSDRNELRAAVQSISQSDSRSSYGELSQSLRGLAKSNHQPVEAHIFTDMQQSSMPSPFAELAVPSNVHLVLHPIGSGKPEPNYFVESVNAPHAVYKANKTRVQATIAGENTPPGNVQASIVLNNRVLESKPVTLGENGRAAVEFSLPEIPYGLNRGIIRVTAQDSLPQDNDFPFAIERKEPSRILLIHEARNSRGVLYVTNALEASPEAAFTMDAVTTEQSANVSPERYSFVILSDVASIAPQLEQALTMYVKRGGSVLIALGPAAATRSQVPIVEMPVMESRYSSKQGDIFQAVASTDSTHPVVQHLNDFEGARFFQTVRVNPKDARVIAKLTDQTPLLLESKVGEGRVLVFTSTFDNISNDLPLHASFVPFVEQTARYLSGFDQAPAQYLVDGFAELRTGKDQGSSVEVLDPDGKRALSLKEAASSPTVRLTREGFYEIRHGNARDELIAVHADRRESNLTPIPKESVQLWQNLGAGSPQSSGNGNGTPSQPGEQPVSLWWYVALAMLVMAIVESIFADKYLAVGETTPLVKKEAA